MKKRVVQGILLAVLGIITVIGGITFIIVGDPDPSWKEFSSPQGGFSVLMPRIPKEEKNIIVVGPGGASATTHSFVVNVGEGAYVVSYIDAPAEVDFSLDAAHLDAMRERLISGFNAKIVKETSIVLDGNQGTEFSFEITKPKKGNGVARTYIVNRRSYQLAAVGSNINSSSPDVQRFFSSFKLM